MIAYFKIISFNAKNYKYVFYAGEFVAISPKRFFSLNLRRNKDLDRED